MEESERNKILRRIESIEAAVELILKDATAIRKELGGGTPGSPKGKSKKKNQIAAETVLRNRRLNIARGKKD